MVFTTVSHTLRKSARAHVRAVYQVFILVVAMQGCGVWIIEDECKVALNSNIQKLNPRISYDDTILYSTENVNKTALLLSVYDDEPVPTSLLTKQHYNTCL